MKRGRKSKYIHLLRAMRAGDTLYLQATAPRFDRQVSGTINHEGGKASTINVVAVNVDRVTAQHLLCITIIKPLKGKRT